MKSNQRIASGRGDQRKNRRGSMFRRASNLKKFSPAVSTDLFWGTPILDEDVSKEAEKVEFRGPYAHLRKELDYTYHVHYRKERQWLQDSIVEDILEANMPSDLTMCITPTEPWLLFTVGSRGAGKRHVIRELSNDGRLPLLSFVRVDSDEIRRRLPEFNSYSRENPCLVDELTRKESGFISELVLLAALQAGRNVIFDGAMASPQWHIQLVKKLRKEYPSLKFGLMHITAPTDIILERARKHYLETGRDITRECVVSHCRDIQGSVRHAKSHFDFFCQIENGKGPIELVGKDWKEFHRRFLQACAWKPGIKGKQKISRQISTEESKKSRGICVMKQKKRRRRFSVKISSEENNRSDNRNFYGKFSHIRKTLDYNYHSNYTFERQKLQDAIINDMLDAAIILDVDGKIGSVPTEPWIVFTAGAMGAGKSHTMNTLVERGYFPLKAFVIVDPDEIRRYLPEYHMYINENPELAGELTRKEAGFIAEILTLAALQAGKNVLQDGSLRDSDWYQQYFSRLREEFPAVRQAILHVTAPREAVFQRAAERALTTGRIVPRDVLEKALEQVPRSVNILAPLVDYYAELHNAKDVELTKPESSSWDDFRSVWNQRVAYVASRRKVLKALGKTNNQQHLIAADGSPHNVTVNQ